MTLSQTSIDDLFRALSAPPRRQVIEALSYGPASVSTLAEPFDMALPSFVQHLKVLESAGLVASSKTGRVRTYRLVPDRLVQVESWLGEQRRMWERRLDQLDDYLLQLKEEGYDDKDEPAR